MGSILKNTLSIGSMHTVAAGASVTLEGVVSDYGLLHAWSGDNSSEVSTTTTMTDYQATYNLVNPAAGNQPVLNSADADFNSKNSLTFDGTSDYTYNTVNNFRNGDSSGVIYIVYRPIGTGINQYLFAAGDETSGTRLSGIKCQDLKTQFITIGGTGGTRIMESNTLLSVSSSYVVAIASTGSAYKFWLNGVAETVNAVSGANDGLWNNTFANGILDNITLGAVVYTSNIYANAKIAFTGYAPYVDDATIVNASNDLATYYGI